MQTIHIIGGGVSGLATAAKLVETKRDDMRVIIHEASPYLGGRCRSYDDTILGQTIDNGNHLLLGANKAARKLMAMVEVEDRFLSPDPPSYLSVDMESRKFWHTKPPYYFKRIPMREWWHILKLLTPGQQMRVNDCIPSDSRLYHELIEPLTLAAMNTHPDLADARTLGRLLLELLTGGRDAGRYFLPKQNWNHALIQPTAQWVMDRGVEIRTGSAVKNIVRDEVRITALETSGDTITLGEQDSIIMALGAFALQKLLPEAIPHAILMKPSTILNVHFRWPQAGKLRDKLPIIGVINGTAHWVFFHDGRIATTTSAANSLMDEDDKTLAKRSWEDVKRVLYMAPETPVPTCRVIREKQATFAATPDAMAARPATTLHFAKNVLIAGDIAFHSYPPTIEAAIGNGFNAALELLRQKNG